VAAKILVVEEDEPLKQLLQSRLEAQGFNVITAVDGEAALRAVGFEMPDAIILDLELQGQDGLSVCRQLRANPETARVPLLVLSGEGEQIDQLLSNDLDADDFMTKPLDLKKLLVKIKRILFPDKKNDHEKL